MNIQNLLRLLVDDYLSKSEIKKACEIFSKIENLYKMIIYQNLIFIV